MLKSTSWLSSTFSPGGRTTCPRQKRGRACPRHPPPPLPSLQGHSDKSPHQKCRYLLSSLISYKFQAMPPLPIASLTIFEFFIHMKLVSELQSKVFPPLLAASLTASSPLHTPIPGPLNNIPCSLHLETLGRLLFEEKNVMLVGNF